MILTVRGQKLILDSDLARIYGVATRVLNQAVKRKVERFPEDFIFALTASEFAEAHSQRGASTADSSERNRSQIVTGSPKHIDPRFLPYAFTEHGAIMAANVLNRGQAAAMSVYVIRAFVRMREELVANQTLSRRLAEIETTLIAHDAGLRDLYQKIRPLLLPAEPPRREIGFHLKPDPGSSSSSPPAAWRGNGRKPTRK